MMRLFRRNSKSISNTSDTSQQVITPSDNSQDIIEDNTNTTTNNNNTDGEENQIPVDISAVERVDEMDNTLVNSVSGDTNNTSTEIAPNTTTIDTTDTNNTSTVTTKNTSSSNSTAGDGRNVENDVVKRRNNMRSRRKSMKNYNNSYHNSPYYSHYASPNYANNYTGPNYSTANYTNNYGAPNYPTHSYTFGNFNKYYPAQYNTNASTAYGANVNNTSNSVVNTSTLNSMNSNSVLNNGVASNNVSNSIISKIGLLKNRQSSALQILNPHTGEVINSSTVNNTNTTTTHTNNSTNTVTVDTTTAENNNTLESMESIDSMENVMREISEEFNNINNLDISSSNDTSIQNTTISSTVDMVTSDLNNIPSTVDLVNNDINNIPSAVDLVNNDLNIPSAVNLVTSGTMVNGMNGMNDVKEVESIDWQDNTPTQMVPPILLISVQSRPKNKIKNKAINPAEMILTLSELHPNPNISTPNSHSKSHSRKIYNVPTEDAHTDEENVNNIVTGVSEENTSTKIAEPIFVDTYSTTPEDITLITANASGEDTNIEEDSVDTVMEDVNGVSVVVDVESSNVEKQGFDYSVDNLIRLSFSVFNLEFEDLGTFKLVPHNYVIRKKPKKSQWRDISNNTATIVSTGSGTLNSVNGRMSKLDQLKRSIRTLLNKLTVENFLVVSEKIVTLYREMSLREEVEVLVELLHEKGTTELEYADMYADVAFLLRYSYNDVLDLGNKTTLFHKSLLNKCQDSFEQINSNSSLDKSVILGSIRFMGELFLRKILSINILKRISNTLLYSSRRVVPTTTTTNGTEGTTDTTDKSAEGTTITNGTSSSQDSTEVTGTNTTGPDTVTEENTSNNAQITNTNTTTSTTGTDTSTDNVDISNGVSDTLSEFGAEPPMNLLECFVELLTTIGYTVEQIPGGVQMLDEYTGILIQLRNSGKYPTRINFKIQDLIDLRRRNWKLKLFKEKATSVSQIHKQVEQEQLTGTINSVEGKYITAGLQVNRHYTQFLLDKRQMAIDSLVNGVYTGSTVSGSLRCSITVLAPTAPISLAPKGASNKSNIDEMMSITKEFESLCSSEAFEALWKKFNPNDSETIVLFQQMLKICMNNGDLDSGLKMSDLIAFLISKIIDSDTLKAKLLNILCNNYVVRLNEEASENEHVVSFVTRIFTILFCRLSGESRNLLEKISLPNDFNTAKQLCVAVVHSVREYSTVDLGSTRRIIRRHLYSTFQHENLLFLDLI
uniref:MIF4G domain containing protein, putative n=1 Tax=Theileria annulata TaxID=5874 RepID=A0A3B0N3X5_THEAN